MKSATSTTPTAIRNRFDFSAATPPTASTAAAIGAGTLSGSEPMTLSTVSRMNCDHLREGDHQRGRHRQHVITLAALEEHEEQAGTAHLFLLFCLHNSSHIACPHGEPDPPPSNTANI